ncbi:UPF0648 protein C3H5.09c [Ceratocystis lukuohia]|uniref:UPF0648 protein C3H5.09c n=1 Tax=Ceratocystis lukuohia TaxID=2019550 RepID=A0ABR4MT28_9PEZI
MALFNPSFVFGVAVLLYLCSLVFFAILRILTGVSIQRLGFSSLRRISYTPRDGIRIDIRGLGLNLHRPTFAQPTWLSIVVDELAITINRTQLENSARRGDDCDSSTSDVEEDVASSLPADSLLAKTSPNYITIPSSTPTITRNGDTLNSPIENDDPFNPPIATPAESADASNNPGSTAAPTSPPSPKPSRTLEMLTKLKDRIKKLHRNIKWLRMVDFVATNSSISMVGVGSIQCGSFNLGVDTRSRLVDRTWFFNAGADQSAKKKKKDQAEWNIALRSVLFTAEGKESIDIVDNITLNIHGFLIDSQDGLRNASIALKLGRVHIPWDDISLSLANLKKMRKGEEAATPPPIFIGGNAGIKADSAVSSGLDEAFQPAPLLKPPQRIPTFNSTVDNDMLQRVADSKELIMSILRGIKEVQFAVSYVAVSKQAEADYPGSPPLTMTASMKEVGIDLHRLNSKSPAHRMYFDGNDIAHEALAAALSISVGINDGSGKHQRLVYIPMATTTMKTTLPSKTVELVKRGSPEERNTNILFANSVITSPSLDLSPHQIPLLIRLLKPKPKRRVMQQLETPDPQKHHLISRLLPKANIKFSMHEPVMRISLSPLKKTEDSDDSDLIISSISSISLEIESFHSAVQELHYSLASTMRLQTHKLYYQTASGERLDLTQTESFDMRIQLSAAPDVFVVVNGTLKTSTIKMLRPEFIEGLRQIVHQLHQDVQGDKKKSKRPSTKQNFLRALPSWLLHVQIQMSDVSMEVAGTDVKVSDDTRGMSVQLDSLTTEYRAQRLDSLQRHNSRRRTRSRSMTPDADILKTPLSPTPRKKMCLVPGDGRKLGFHVKGLEVFIIESISHTEVEPFVRCPRAEVTLSSMSDTHGPVFHLQANMRSVLINWSLYRHYAMGVALMVLRKAFTPMPSFSSDEEPLLAESKAPAISSEVEYLSPPQSPSSLSLNRGQLQGANMTELFTADVNVSLVQIKATMPHEPRMLLQVFGLEIGRHRWSAPYLTSCLIRLSVNSPRISTVWSRVLSIKAARLDYRQSRKKVPSGGYVADKLIELYAESIRLAIPYEVLLNRITDNLINTMKSVQQLHYRFKTDGEKQFPFDKGPVGPKVPPRISIRTRAFLFEIEDGAFEWKLGMIYRAGLVEQQQRLAREEAFRLKTKIVQEESRKSSRTKHKRGQASAGTLDIDKEALRNRSNSHHHHGSHSRNHGPSYDPENNMPCLSNSASPRLKLDEARAKLDTLHASSWKKRIDRACAIAEENVREFRSAALGPSNTPDDIEEAESILEVPARAALASAYFTDLQITIDKPSFPLKDLPAFMHSVGKGIPKDTQYSLLVPLHINIDTSEARISLRDYPLPFIHVPPLEASQSTKKNAFSLSTDFVIAEEYRGPESLRPLRIDIIKPNVMDFEGAKTHGYHLEIRRTIGAVKTYSNMKVDVNTSLPTRITWGPCYQPAIQDMMTVIETFTKPQLDPSERVGFWDKIRLSFHSRIHIAWRGDGDVLLSLKGTRDPYCLMGTGAGFLMCWRNDVRLNLNAEDDPKRFMTVNSGEYVLAIPDYAQLVRAMMRRDRDGQDENPQIDYDDNGPVISQDFQKVVMKLGGKVQWMIGLVFEQAIVNGKRSFDFKPHYNVILRDPSKAKPDRVTGLPYDAFRGFRSSHIHLSIAVRAPVDRDWMATTPQPSRSYNTVHMTPRFFTHFYQWLSLFGGGMSLPIRQGKLWPGRDKGSKKFGRHVATLKYNLLLAPLFLTHIYKHKDPDTDLEDGSMATGIKVRFDSFMLDLHQRREEFNTQDHGRKTQSRTSGIKIHAAQLDLVSTDIRAVSATMRSPGRNSGLNLSEMPAMGVDDDASSSMKQDVSDKEDDGPDNSRFTIPDNDMTWIDVDDFVELDWILPSERNLDTKILPLAFSPRLTYFRQTDIGGVIAGDPERTSPFGNEPTHFCIMSYDDDPRRVQQRLVNDRLSRLQGQMDSHALAMDEAEVGAIKRDHDAESMAQLEMLRRQSEIFLHKKAFLEHMILGLAVRAASVSGTSFDSNSNSPRPKPDDNCSSSSSFSSGNMPPGASIKLPTGAEFESDYNNRFVIHNLHFKWNNELRNIVLRYFDQVSLRRGLVYYLSRPAVKFILDIVEEQERAKFNTPKRSTTAKSYVAGNKSSNSHSGIHVYGPQNNGSGGRDTDQSSIPSEADEAIRKLMEDGRRFIGEIPVDSSNNCSSSYNLGHNHGHNHNMSSSSIGSSRDMDLGRGASSERDRDRDRDRGSSSATSTSINASINGSSSGLNPNLNPRVRARRDSSTNSFIFGSNDAENGAAACSSDLSSGISAGFMPKKSYHVRLIAPQIQLQSDQNQKNVVLLTSKGMELKVVEVMDKKRLSDNVSGLVQRRFQVNMDSTQFFVTHRKWFQNSQLVAMGAYGGSSYGAPLGSMWPPWVPMEVMFDFETDPFGFKRVVQKTSGMMRYDKFNTLRLKYNDKINTENSSGGQGSSSGNNNSNNTSSNGNSVSNTVDTDSSNVTPNPNPHANPDSGAASTSDPRAAPPPNQASKEPTDSRMDYLWVDFPQARALCNSSQYYAMYVIVLDLLMYNEPTEKIRNERLEKIMLASDFSDLSGIPETVSKMQHRIRQLEHIRQHFQTFPRGSTGGPRNDGVSANSLRKDRMTLSNELAACEEELFFMMKAITSSQRKHNTYGAAQTSTPLLRWSITARDIVWHLVRDTNDPLVELQLRDVEYHRTDSSDGSHFNLIQVGKILGLNLLPDALYPEIISPYYDAKHAPLFQGQKMIQVYWYMLEAIAGITVMEDFEVNLFPMRIQLERDVGKKLLEYIFPGMNDGESPKDVSPFIIKRHGGDGSSVASDEDDDDEDDDHDHGDTDDDTGTDGEIDHHDSSLPSATFSNGLSDMGSPSSASLEMRLRPTLTSLPRAHASSAQATSDHHHRTHRGPHFNHQGHRRRQKSVSIRTGGEGTSSSTKTTKTLLRANTLRIPTKKHSSESLRSTTPSLSRPGLIRPPPIRLASSSSAVAVHGGGASSTTSVVPGLGTSSNDVTGKAGRFGLRRRETSARPSRRRRRRRGSHSDDVTKMMARANKFMAFAHINVPSVLLCLSYKGKDARNFEDVHDLVFRMPQIEWHNKTWSNLDLVEALKKAVIRALISHTGAIIGNKLRHLPTAAASQVKGVAHVSSSVILSQAAVSAAKAPSIHSNSGQNLSLSAASVRYAESFSNISDDSASVFGANSTVDFSRSPPPSIRNSNKSIRPRSNSRSSSVHSGCTTQSQASNSNSSVAANSSFGPSLKPNANARSSSINSSPIGAGFASLATSYDEIAPSRNLRSAHEMRPTSQGGLSLFTPRMSAAGDDAWQRPVTSASHLDTPTGNTVNPFAPTNTTTITAGIASSASSVSGIGASNNHSHGFGFGGEGKRKKFRDKLSSFSPFAKLGHHRDSTVLGPPTPSSSGVAGFIPESEGSEAMARQESGSSSRTIGPANGANRLLSVPTAVPATVAMGNIQVTAHDNGHEDMYLVEDEGLHENGAQLAKSQSHTRD